MNAMTVPITAVKAINDHYNECQICQSQHTLCDEAEEIITNAENALKEQKKGTNNNEQSIRGN